ncbi:MAG: hypothetical protein KDE27_17790 [Planctomycetes bacterium]|nr:hypothetical protein [Planctomycetota bacterium]
MRPHPSLAALAFLLTAVACSKEGSAGGGAGDGAGTPAKPPATVESAKAMLSKFVAPGADHVALSKTMQPTAADYALVFADPVIAEKAANAYGDLWNQIDKSPIAPKDGQTEVLVSRATTDELQQWTGNADDFPGGYKTAAKHLRPGLTVFRFKFVKPGETSGMAFDGLYDLDGRWVLIPKPWRIVE